MIEFDKIDKAFDFNLTTDDKSAINEAVATAYSNGSKQTLILTEENALVVAIQSQKIIKVIKREELRRGISTKIDSVVVIKRD